MRVQPDGGLEFGGSAGAGKSVDLRIELPSVVLIANVAHPAFIFLGAYLALALSQALHLDPIVSGMVLVLPFYFLGNALYLFYNRAFERRGESSLAGLVLFFGLLILLEVGMASEFGVGLKAIYSPYGSVALNIGPLSLPLRFVYSFVAGVAAVVLLEKLWARGETVARLAGVASIGLAVALIWAPALAPGLQPVATSMGL